MKNIFILFLSLTLFASCSNNHKTNQEAFQYSQKIYKITEEVGLKSKSLESVLIALTGKAMTKDIDSIDISSFYDLKTELNKLTDKVIQELNKLEEFDNQIKFKEIVLNEKENYKKLINGKYIEYINIVIKQNDEIKNPKTYKLLLEIVETLIDNQEEIYLTQNKFAAKYNFEMESDKREEQKFIKYRKQLQQLKNSEPN